MEGAFSRGEDPRDQAKKGQAKGAGRKWPFPGGRIHEKRTEKGRAKEWGLLGQAREAAALQVAAHVGWRRRYVETDRNPSDKDSRAPGSVAAGPWRGPSLLERTPCILHKIAEV